MKKIVVLIFFTLITQSFSASKYNDQETRPYKFGFEIDGQQHRRESKDENGIVMGEFGFVTADGIYHVTVYATDENGNFKIVKMQNIRLDSITDFNFGGISLPQKTQSPITQPPKYEPQKKVEVIPLKATPKPFNAIPTTQKPTNPKSQYERLTTAKPSNVQSCSNCKIPTTTTTTTTPKPTKPAVGHGLPEKFKSPDEKPNQTPSHYPTHIDNKGPTGSKPATPVLQQSQQPKPHPHSTPEKITISSSPPSGPVLSSKPVSPSAKPQITSHSPPTAVTQNNINQPFTDSLLPPSPSPPPVLGQISISQPSAQGHPLTTPNNIPPTNTISHVPTSTPFGVPPPVSTIQHSSTPLAAHGTPSAPNPQVPQQPSVSTKPSISSGPSVSTGPSTSPFAETYPSNKDSPPKPSAQYNQPTEKPGKLVVKPLQLGGEIPSSAPVQHSHTPATQPIAVGLPTPFGQSIPSAIPQSTPGQNFVIENMPSNPLIPSLPAPILQQMQEYLKPGSTPPAILQNTNAYAVQNLVAVNQHAQAPSQPQPPFTQHQQPHHQPQPNIPPHVQPLQSHQSHPQPQPQAPNQPQLVQPQQQQYPQPQPPQQPQQPQQPINQQSPPQILSQQPPSQPFPLSPAVPHPQQPAQQYNPQIPTQSHPQPQQPHQQQSHQQQLHPQNPHPQQPYPEQPHPQQPHQQQPPQQQPYQQQPHQQQPHQQQPHQQQPQQQQPHQIPQQQQYQQTPQAHPGQPQHYQPQNPQSHQTVQATGPVLEGLLYNFNYTAGFHGHNEQGDHGGNKEGSFYSIGRDGYRRTVDYKASNNGFQPRIHIEYAKPEEIPHPETEKEKGSQGYEFKWFYLQ